MSYRDRKNDWVDRLEVTQIDWFSDQLYSLRKGPKRDTKLRTSLHFFAFDNDGGWGGVRAILTWLRAFLRKQPKPQRVFAPLSKRLKQRGDFTVSEPSQKSWNSLYFSHRGDCYTISHSKGQKYVRFFTVIVTPNCVVDFPSHEKKYLISIPKSYYQSDFIMRCASKRKYE